jgi:hypothetical protein
VEVALQQPLLPMVIKEVIQYFQLSPLLVVVSALLVKTT